VNAGVEDLIYGLSPSLSLLTGKERLQTMVSVNYSPQESQLKNGSDDFA
jgi:hypothetical protein